MNGLKKRMHGKFVRDMDDKDKNNTWRLMRKSDLKECSEAFFFFFFLNKIYVTKVPTNNIVNNK